MRLTVVNMASRKAKQREALDLLRTYLERNPQLRIGQAVGNLIPDTYRHDPFYMSDEEMIAALRERL